MLMRQQGFEGGSVLPRVSSNSSVLKHHQRLLINRSDGRSLAASLGSGRVVAAGFHVALLRNMKYVLCVSLQRPRGGVSLLFCSLILLLRLCMCVWEQCKRCLLLCAAAAPKWDSCLQVLILSFFFFAYLRKVSALFMLAVQVPRCLSGAPGAPRTDKQFCRGKGAFGLRCSSSTCFQWPKTQIKCIIVSNEPKSNAS